MPDSTRKEYGYSIINFEFLGICKSGEEMCRKPYTVYCTKPCKFLCTTTCTCSDLLQVQLNPQENLQQKFHNVDVKTNEDLDNKLGTECQLQYKY